MSELLEGMAIPPKTFGDGGLTMFKEMQGAALR
jgi:hypothetical protein